MLVSTILAYRRLAQCIQRWMRAVLCQVGQGLNYAFQILVGQRLIEMFCLPSLAVESKHGWSVLPGLLAGWITAIYKGETELILLHARNEQSDFGFCHMTD